MRFRVIGSLALATALAGGCALQEPAPEDVREPPAVAVPAPPPTATDAENLLRYYQHIRRIGPAELAREHESARHAFARSRADYNRVRLAMLLSLPGTAFADDARALELLDPLTKNPNGSLHALAFLLAAQLQERRRLEASAQSLQQKLDALRSLERSLIERKR
jgi:hypothetical protein